MPPSPARPGIVAPMGETAGGAPKIGAGGKERPLLFTAGVTREPPTLPITSQNMSQPSKQKIKSYNTT